MKRGLLILGYKKFPDSTSLYDVVKLGRVIGLWYSKAQDKWHHKGKLAYTLLDTGNGFRFKDSVTKTELTFDYCQAEALRALLKLEDNDGATFECLERK